MEYYTLNYVNWCGDTITRDYFDDIKKAEAFMDELISTYKNEGADTGLRLEDSNGNLLWEYYPPIEEDYDDEEYFD